MQPLVTDSLLPSAAPTGNAPRVAARRDADAAQDRDPAQPADNPVSIRVILSDDALERAAKARKAAFHIPTNVTQSRHDLARARIAQIKERIDTLKKMLMFLGKAAAKFILRELRQLAGELGQAARVLKDSAGAQPAADTSLGAVAAPVVQGADGTDAAPAASPASTADGTDAANAANAEGGQSQAAASRALAAYAAASDTAVHADADTADTPDADSATQSVAAKDTSVPGDTDKADSHDDKAATAVAESRQDPQAAQKRRQDDAQAVRDAIRAMKELLSMLKNKLRQHDKEAQKQAAEVRDTLAEVEKTAYAIENGGASNAGMSDGVGQAASA